MNIENQSVDALERVPDVLTRKGAAAYLSISPGTLDKLPIPRVQIRRRVVYRKADLEAWLNTHVNEWIDANKSMGGAA